MPRRAREAARVAARLGNADEASAFAREQLALARIELLLVRITNASETNFEQAIAELDDSASFAVGIGDDVLDAKLVVEAAQFMLAPQRARKPIARALSTLDEADLSWGYTRLWRRSASTRACWLPQRLRWRGHRAPGLPFGTPRLAPSSLAVAGPEAVDLLWTEADRAATENRRADFVRWIDAIREADRWNVHALASKAVIECARSR